jgi:hypothetical protein
MTVLNILVEDPNSASGWLMLENERMGLRIGADTMAQITGTVKKTQASNPFIPGTYTVRAVQDNATSPVSVNVYEDDPAIRSEKVEYLVALFTRAAYSIVTKYETKAWMTTAQAADYQINNQREFLHGGLSIVTFNVSFLPGRTEVLM